MHAYLVGLDLFLSGLPSTAFLCARSDKTMGPRCVRAANALITVYVHMLVWVVDVRILVDMHVLQIVQVNS